MSRRFKISSLIVLVAFAFVIATGAKADDEWKKTGNPGDLKFDETFTLDAGDRLRVEVQDSDVQIIEGNNASARVEVFVSARGSEKADEYFDDSRFRARLNDNTLLVETRFPRHRNWSFWDSYRHVDMHIIVTIPRGTSARLRTDDGDIRVEKLQGDLRAATSDGDIIVGAIDGKVISLATSDGDVRAGALKAEEVEVKSSDGDVRAKQIVAEIITFSTSDGDVVIGSAHGETMSMNSSDGDITVGAEAGKLSARTSDGDITITIQGSTVLNLRTHDGDVRIEAPAGIKADLDLRGERVRVSGDVNIKGEVGRQRVVGELGGGGASIVARTSDGSISLHLR